MRRIAGLGLALVLLGAGVAPRAARAGQCGGDVPCRCGDTLTGRYALGEDLGPCDGDGLVLRGAAVLDCRQHTISGSGRPDTLARRRDAGKTFGIILESTAGAVVRSCKVTGFQYGIEFRHARGSQVVGCETFRNGDFRTHVGYGIHLSQSQENTVQDCTVRDSADEGIHIGNGSDRNTLVGNYAHDNTRENYYILSASGTHLLRNRAGGVVVADLYMKYATDSRIEENRFDHHPVVVRGSSARNVFTDNRFGAGLRFEAYGDEVQTAPSENVVRGGRIEANGVCFELVEAHDNRIEGVELKGCRGISARASKSATNDLLGMRIEDVGLSLAGGAVFRLAANVHVRARTPQGEPIAGAAVSMRDATGETRAGPSTGADGDATCAVVTHVLNASGLIAVTPVALTVRADGHEPAHAVVDDPPADSVTVTLKPSA